MRLPPFCRYVSVINLGRKGRQTAEQRGHIGDKGPDAVNDHPGDPDALEPVPGLVHLVLVVGQLGAHHGHSGHQAGQNGADAGDLAVDVHDDAVGDGPKSFVSSKVPLLLGAKIERPGRSFPR